MLELTKIYLKYLVFRKIIFIKFINFNKIAITLEKSYVFHNPRIIKSVTCMKQVKNNIYYHQIKDIWHVSLINS